MNVYQYRGIEGKECAPVSTKSITNSNTLGAHHKTNLFIYRRDHSYSWREQSCC